MNAIRVNYLTTEQNFALEVACAPLSAAGLHVYLVGSVLERANWRDVDLRCVDIEGEFGSIIDNPVMLRIVNAAMSGWLRERTGLPVDFQFQSMAENQTYRGNSRSAMGILIECEADKRKRAALKDRGDYAAPLRKVGTQPQNTHHGRDARKLAFPWTDRTGSQSTNQARPIRSRGA